MAEPVCLYLTAAEKADLIALGWTEVSGPHLTEGACLIVCGTSGTGTGSGTDTETGTGTGTVTGTGTTDTGTGTQNYWYCLIEYVFCEFCQCNVSRYFQFTPNAFEGTCFDCDSQMNQQFTLHTENNGTLTKLSECDWIETEEGEDYPDFPNVAHDWCDRQYYWILRWYAVGTTYVLRLDLMDRTFEGLAIRLGVFAGALSYAVFGDTAQFWDGTTAITLPRSLSGLGTIPCENVPASITIYPVISPAQEYVGFPIDVEYWKPTCQFLSVGMLNHHLEHGKTQLGGPYDTLEQCLSECPITTLVSGTGTGTYIPGHTGTGTTPFDPTTGTGSDQPPFPPTPGTTKWYCIESPDHTGTGTGTSTAIGTGSYDIDELVGCNFCGCEVAKCIKFEPSGFSNDGTACSDFEQLNTIQRLIYDVAGNEVNSDSCNWHMSDPSNPGEFDTSQRITMCSDEFSWNLAWYFASLTTLRLVLVNHTDGGESALVYGLLGVGAQLWDGVSPITLPLLSASGVVTRPENYPSSITIRPCVE